MKNPSLDIAFRSCQVPGVGTIKVPPFIYRIDTPNTAGWQIRVWTDRNKEVTEFVSDSHGEEDSKLKSLGLAAKRLQELLMVLPIGDPPGLRIQVSPKKSNEMPVGVSGPKERVRKGRVPYADFQVACPVYGETMRRRNVYIASMYTYSASKEKAALKKAVQMRKEAIEKYVRDWNLAEFRRRQEIIKRLAAFKAGECK